MTDAVGRDVEPQDVAEAARVARAVVAELDDPESELTGSAAMRNRLEGAAVTLETCPETVISQTQQM